MRTNIANLLLALPFRVLNVNLNSIAMSLQTDILWLIFRMEAVLELDIAIIPVTEIT
jgi:hypothetical protein